MNLPFFVASRYFLSKKKKHVINIISGISIAGVMIGTFALVLILSVFNGFDEVIKNLFSSFDPELRITPATGKRISLDSPQIKLIKTTSGIKAYSFVLEENCLLKYNNKTSPARIKGVDVNYHNVTGIDTTMIDTVNEKTNDTNFCYVGQGVAYQLGVNLNFIRAMVFYAPKRGGGNNLQAYNAFNKDFLIPSGVFSIRQEIDAKYIIVPLEFAMKLFDTRNQISAIELKLNLGTDIDFIQKELEKKLGANFIIKNRYQQHEFFYKVMKSEKWAIFLILSFILIIASFNIIGSLTMLIIDKKNDVKILQSLGANNKLINRIFLMEGIMITTVGALIGLLLGFIVAYVQQKYGLIKINTTGALIIDTYPVKIVFTDFLWVIGVVLGIGFFASYFPVKLLTNYFFNVKK